MMLVADHRSEIAESSSHTFRHEKRVAKSHLDFLIERQLLEIQRVALSHQLTKTATHVEVVCKGNAVTRSDLEDFVFTIAVESRPLDVLGMARPIEGGGVALMTNDKLTTVVRAWKTDNERAELQIRSRSVDVWLEETRWSLIDLRSESVTATSSS
jgi:hypothetical protein